MLKKLFSTGITPVFANSLAHYLRGRDAFMSCFKQLK